METFRVRIPLGLHYKQFKTIIKMEGIYLLLAAICLIQAILTAELSWLIAEQEYLHYKKYMTTFCHACMSKRRYMLTVFKLQTDIIISLIPILQTLHYVSLVKKTMKTPFVYSGKYMLEDICSWENYINCKIWKKWKPSDKWKRKYPIE